MKHSRRHEILWELIDQMFTTVEYWPERSTAEDLTLEERKYLYNVISKFAKSRAIYNHVYIN